MSRIGKLPIPVPNGVEVKIGTDVVEVKGPKGSLSTPVCSLLQYEQADGHVVLTRIEDDRVTRAQHGLRRPLGPCHSQHGLLCAARTQQHHGFSPQ